MRASFASTFASFCALAVSVGLLAACSGSNATSVASAETDATRLQEVLGSDPARTLLQEIEEAIDAERPVMAAEMIQQAGLPAVRRQIERLQAAPVVTPEGRHLRTRAVRIHRGRAEALTRYGEALARGIGTEDEALLAAMRAYAEAELELVALYRDLEQLNPLAAESEDSDQAARLGGLPPIHRVDDDHESSDDEPRGEEGSHDVAPRDVGSRAEGPVPPVAGEPQEPLPEL